MARQDRLVFELKLNKPEHFNIFTIFNIYHRVQSCLDYYYKYLLLATQVQNHGYMARFGA